MRTTTLTILALGLVLSACRREPDDVDGDGVSALDDCNDEDSAVYPGADELCNGIDDDCSGDVDEGTIDGITFFADFDSDGSGNADVTVSACDAPAGYVAESGDCDDADAARHPGATEDDCADPVDYNCDGSSGYADADVDGFAACEDCDDTDAYISPFGTEVCDGVDNDCDGTADTGAVNATMWYADTDADGFGDMASAQEACDQPENHVGDSSDCDDTSDSVHPGADEVCNTADDNCNDVVDESATDAVTYYADIDGDGEGGTDGISLDACAAPAGFVANADDCNDLWDAQNSGTVWYEDFDADGYGDPTVALTQCAEPTGYVMDDTDCDDVDADINPQTWWFDDFDGDSYGDPDLDFAQQSCLQPSGYVANWDDCNDLEAAANWAEPEVCDGIDNDCDGVTDPPMVYEEFLTPPTAWSINGDAYHQVDPWSGSGWLTLTDAAADQAGSFFYDTPVSSSAFYTAFAFDISGGSEADGMTFAILNGTDSSVVGNGGGGLGCEGLDAVCIGIDTLSNDRLRMFHGSDAATAIEDVDLGKIWNAGPHRMDVVWDDGDYQIFFNSQLVAEGVWDQSTYPLDSEVYLGFTAGTGTQDQSHALAVAYLACDGSGIDEDEDGYGLPDDCDDNNPVVTPDAFDTLGDGVDLNCDGADGMDADGDGWANATSGGIDCDDSDPSSFPGDGVCPLFESCLDLLTDDPSLTDGFYTVFPGGVPLSTYCNMSGGGWTAVDSEDPDDGIDTAWSNTQSTSCGQWGTIMGGYGLWGNNVPWVQKTVDLSGIPHTEVNAEAEFIKIDSWDNHQFYVNIDGSRVWTSANILYTEGTQQCGSGSASWNEEAYVGGGALAHTADSVVVRFGSTIDQGATDESWGINESVVWVR